MRSRLRNTFACISAICVALFFGRNASAQNADTLQPVSIAPITVTAARLETSNRRLPFAVSALNRLQLQSAQAQQSLNESLIALPGVFTLNADNFSQDLRISVRGFGARAAFGIRGIRLFTDGLPESTPDGQADVDNIDPGVLQSMELLRGASAGLYGNASGGALNLRTEEPAERPFVEAQAAGGTFDFQRYQIKTGFTKGKTGVFSGFTRQETRGYRRQSAMRQSTFNFKLRSQLSEATRLSFLFNYANSPFAEDAGGLTGRDATSFRQQARVANVSYDAGESVEQGRAGLILEHKISQRSSLQARAFATLRDFANRLAFERGGWVEFDRLFGGGGVTYRYERQRYRMETGLEWNGQRDKRQRFVNNFGQKGEITFDQIERFKGAGAFWTSEFRPAAKLSLNAALRLDRVRLSAADRYLSDGDQSGDRQFYRFNPVAGLSWAATSAVNFYANAGSNFETPTLNELSANPANAGGFNSELKPQQSVNYEAGTKIYVAKRFNVDVAAFLIRLRDELVPYQLASEPGRTFFRNAGRSNRRGLESALNARLLPSLYATLNYVYSDFRYDVYEANGTQFDGKRQPAIPRHYWFASLQWSHRSGFFVAAQWRRVSDMFVNDANTEQENAYQWASARAAYTFKRARFGWIEPFLGANNIFGAAYSNNLLINAAGNRYYEPAADFATFYGGVKIRLQGKEK